MGGLLDEHTVWVVHEGWIGLVRLGLLGKAVLKHAHSRRSAFVVRKVPREASGVRAVDRRFAMMVLVHGSCNGWMAGLLMGGTGVSPVKFGVSPNFVRRHESLEARGSKMHSRCSTVSGGTDLAAGQNYRRDACATHLLGMVKTAFRLLAPEFCS